MRLTQLKLFRQYTGLRKELYILFLCQLIDNAGSLVGPMLTLILSAKMGMSAGEIAIYFLIFTAISLPVHLLGGRLTDKINKKLLINVCDITTSFIYILCGIVGLNRVTLCVYMAGSLLQAAESPAYETLVADFTRSDDRERAYSLSYLGMNLGLVLAPTIGGLMITNHLGLMFILSGVFELISIIIFDIFVRDMHAIHDTSNKYEGESGGKNIFAVIFENKLLIPFILIFSISMLCYNMYGYLMPLDINAVHGEAAGPPLYGTVSSLNCITVLIFTAVLTSLLSKLTSLDKMIVGNLLELAGLVLFVVFLGTSPVYYLAILIFTFGEIVNTVTTRPYMTKRIPINYRGRLIAVGTVVSSALMAVGRYFIGKIYDGNSTLAWVIVFALYAVTIVGYALMKKPDRRTYPELYANGTDGTDDD